jgi:hypothetical protein
MAAIRTDPRCPLCGAHLTAEELLAAGEELIDATLGVIAGHCPHCQGQLELLPGVGQLEVGYLNRSGAFDTVLILACSGLAVARIAGGDTLTVQAGGKQYRYAEAE